jgi:hypothetical protein
VTSQAAECQNTKTEKRGQHADVLRARQAGAADAKNKYRKKNAKQKQNQLQSRPSKPTAGHHWGCYRER